MFPVPHHTDNADDHSILSSYVLNAENNTVMIYRQPIEINEKRNEGKAMKLSKTQYIRALQCPKMLWMDKFMPDKAVCNDNLETIFETGTEVGNLARSYFSEYALVDFSFDKKQMIADTENTFTAAQRTLRKRVFCGTICFAVSISCTRIRMAGI